MARILQCGSRLNTFRAIRSITRHENQESRPGSRPLGGGGSRDTEGEPCQCRAEHDFLARRRVAAIDAGGFQTLPEQRDGTESELIGDFVLADEDALLCDARNRVAANCGQGLERMRQCIGSGDRREARRAGERKLRVADRDGRNEMRA